MNKEKVLVGMSGGVDSSVCAMLLKKEGYDVVGATLELIDDNKEAISDAKDVANILKIQHYTFDGKDMFKKHVINYFVDEYKKCNTPNPCIECNKYLKFRFMYNKARELGINYIATGHYAKVEYSDKYKRFVLKKSNNILKDQSYVLWNIDKELLEHIKFPLGDFESKDKIRKIAKDNDLKVENKPDSEDICFIPHGDYKKFLEENNYIQQKSGDIVNKNNVILGKHVGLHRYTIGQRKGLGISSDKPLFVLEYDKLKNRLIVGKEEELYKKEILVNNVNLLLLDDIEDGLKAKVKIRYSKKEADAMLYKVDDKIKVIFDEPQRAVTPGQSAVFYIDDIVLGGGRIMPFD